MVEAYIEKNRMITPVKGKRLFYCLTLLAASFISPQAISSAPSDSDSKILDAKASPADMDAAMAQAVNDFKTWFGIDVSKDNIKEASRKTLHDYYQKLKNCTPGTYKFTEIDDTYGHRELNNAIEPLLILNVNTIRDFDDDRCTVLRDVDKETGTLCHFTKTDLDFMAEMEMGSEQLHSPDFSTMQKYSEILQRACVSAKKHSF
jgi:hypothetical protein